MAVDEKQVASIPELISEVLAVKQAIGETGFLWYRGIECSTYQLLPKLVRDGRPVEEVFGRETRLLTRFRQRSMAYWPEGYPQNDWEHLFAMQHYGMPTRLLDWSENLLVATYFSLCSVPSHTHDGCCQPVVWCMDPVRWNQAMPGLSEYGDSIQVLTTADEEVESYRPESNRRRSKSPVAIFGSHNSKRIVAQRGTFVVWGNDVAPLEAFAEEVEQACLWKFTLAGDRDQLFGDLQALGFGETMVFPELSSLARELNRTEGWR